MKVIYKDIWDLTAGWWQSWDLKARICALTDEHMAPPSSRVTPQCFNYICNPLSQSKTDLYSIQHYP